MRRPLAYLGQGAVYAIAAALIGYFSSNPAYAPVPPEQALIKLSFVHGAQRRGECRRLSQDELAKLAPNMRKPVECPRERLPVLVELQLNREVVFSASLPPTGLSGDGPSRVYERFTIPPGRHALEVKLRDTGRADGFDYIGQRQVDLAPGQILAIDFDPVQGGFRFE